MASWTPRTTPEFRHPRALAVFLLLYLLAVAAVAATVMLPFLNLLYSTVGRI